MNLQRIIFRRRFPEQTDHPANFLNQSIVLLNQNRVINLVEYLLIKITNLNYFVNLH